MKKSYKIIIDPGKKQRSIVHENVIGYTIIDYKNTIYRLTLNADTIIDYNMDKIFSIEIIKYRHET